MAGSLRQRFKVSWDDGPEVEVLTTVTDLIAAVDAVPAESGNNRIALTTLLIYAALTRDGHQLGTYDEWLLVLDSYDEVNAVTADPTRPAPSVTEPLSSPVSLEPTGDPGLPPSEPSPVLSSSS